MNILRKTYKEHFESINVNAKKPGRAAGGGGGRVNLNPSYGFSQNASSRQGVKCCFFVALNTIKSQIFPEIFFEICQVVLYPY